MFRYWIFLQALFRERFQMDDRGATAIEYALIALFVVMAIVGAVGAVGTAVLGLYTSVANAFP